MSMRTETLSLVISGDGKPLGNELGRQERRVGAFAGKVGGMFKGLGKRIGGAVGKLANPMALIGGTAGVMMAARDLMQYQDSISSIGISAGMSAGEMMELEKRIQSAAYTTGQGRDGLAGAMKTMADMTDDNDFAAASLESVGRAATAVSADITTVAGAFAAFQRSMGATSGQAAGLFNTMAAQDSVRSMDGFAKSARALGLSMENFGEYNALVKAFGNEMGGIEQGADAIDKIAIALKQDKRGAVRGKFRAAIDTDGTIKDYKKLLDIMAGMNDRELKNVFRGVGAELVSFDAGKITADFDKYVEKGKNAAFVTDALAVKQKEAKFQINTLTAAAKEFSSAALGPVIADLAAQMNALTSNPEAMEEFRSGLSGIADGLAAVAKLAGVVGKALGAWGNMWEWLGEKSVTVPAALEGVGKNIGKKIGTLDAAGNPAGLNAAIQGKSGTQAKSTPGAVHERLNALPNPRESRPPAVTVNPPEVKNAINVNLTVGADGRVVSETSAPNTSLSANLNRGRFL